MKHIQTDSKIDPAQAWGSVLIFSSVIVLVFALLIFWDQVLSLGNLLIVSLMATIGAVLLGLHDWNEVGQ
ncbi:MAG: hypothetical protein RL111_340 [Pseudomonadota bacterium]|jgi:hypothetical protein